MATYNPAFVLGREREVGSLEVGKRADFLVLDAQDYREVANHFGVNPVARVFVPARVASGAPRDVGTDEAQQREQGKHIRKKALDLVRQQDWANAIKEYRRLVELDQNNPNVHNELADLYLRTNQKNEAFESFMLAIDEYTRVGLFNNAVAVCKKVIRVLPARVEVLMKLGLIRMKQGLAKEAESYYPRFSRRRRADRSRPRCSRNSRSRSWTTSPTRPPCSSVSPRRSSRTRSKTMRAMCW